MSTPNYGPPPADFDLWRGGGPHHLNACVNYSHYPETGYVEGFRRAAEALIRDIEDNRGVIDFLVYPIIYNYRQHLELRLKQILEEFRRYGIYDKPVIKGHDLHKLWSECKPLILEISENVEEEGEWMNGVEKAIGQIMAVDPKGFGFRYSDAGIPKEITHINLENVRTILTWVCDWLEAVAGYIPILTDQKAEAMDAERFYMD
ncbi:MAG TPA: hypothetical protein VIM61_09340 [Chthoniobacterales bacterium]